MGAGRDREQRYKDDGDDGGGSFYKTLPTGNFCRSTMEGPIMHHPEDSHRLLLYAQAA